VETPLLVVVKHADLHCMEEVGLGVIVHETWNMSRHAESSVDMVHGEFGIGSLRVGIGEQIL
jgi:hypothetical protein